jgi:hypothetical protein
VIYLTDASNASRPSGALKIVDRMEWSCGSARVTVET